MKAKQGWCCVLMVLLACDHSDSFVFAGSPLGPFSSGPDVLLTFNTDQDYWPAWTQDGRGIMYAFVDATRPDSSAYGKRCMGILPAGGGTRLWQWCDDRAALFDSLSSFPAFALSHDGRLLYAEATSIRSFAFLPGHLQLWLSDTVHPFRRTSLLSLPTTVGDSVVDWIADLVWTGENSFVGLAQHFLVASHCTGSEDVHTCAEFVVDSMFFGEFVVRGTLSANGATLTAIPGTAGATTYALAESGNAIVFSLRNSTVLWQAPSGGGAASAIGPATPDSGMTVTGLTCTGTSCLVSVAPLVLWAPVIPGPKKDVAKINPGATEIRSISLSSGTSLVTIARSSGVYSSPRLSPLTGDVVVQYGVNMGHLQTFTSSSSDLHLLKGIVP